MGRDYEWACGHGKGPGNDLMREVEMGMPEGPSQRGRCRSCRGDGRR